jgi:hypothetical protein
MKLATPDEGLEECEDNACTGCPWCDAHGITREPDDTPDCRCGTCTRGNYTCISED